MDSSDSAQPSVMTLFKKYITLKEEYFNSYLSPDSLERRPIHRVFDVKTNCPLHFREQNGAYIVEVVHPSCPDIIYYRHSIHVNNTIDLTHLLSQHQKKLTEMHVDEDRLHYLRKIELLTMRKSKLLALQSIPAKNPAESAMGIATELYKEEMAHLENEIQTLRDTFDEWMDGVKRILTEIDIIRDIAVEQRQEKYDSLNTAQIQYFHLWNQQHRRGITKEDNYRLKKELYQDSVIRKGNVVEFNGQWYVVTQGHSASDRYTTATEPIRIKPVHSIFRESEAGEAREQEISVLPSEVVHHEGHYNKWKNFQLTDRVRVSRDEWHEKLVMHGLEDTYGAMGESVVSEYPATPDKKPRQIMMEYIKDDCGLEDRSMEDGADVDEDTFERKKDKKAKKEAKKAKKEAKKEKKRKEESEEESPDEPQEVDEDLVAVEEMEEVSEIPEESEESTTSASASSVERSIETSKGRVAPRGRLMIKIPTKKTRTASPIPMQYSPTRARQITPRKSSLKRRDGDAFCVKPEQFKESQKQLYTKYLESLYDDREQLMSIINDEYPEKMSIFEEEGLPTLDEYPPIRLQYIRSREERQRDDQDEDEEPIDIITDEDDIKEHLHDFENTLRKIYVDTGFVETVLNEKGKRVKILDTVSLYHHLIHEDIQCEWNPSSDEDDGDDEEKTQEKPKKKRASKKKATVAEE